MFLRKNLKGYIKREIKKVYQSIYLDSFIKLFFSIDSFVTLLVLKSEKETN